MDVESCDRNLGVYEFMIRKLCIKIFVDEEFGKSTRKSICVQKLRLLHSIDRKTVVFDLSFV